MISAAVAKVSYVDRPKYLQQSPRHNNSGSVCAFVIPYVDGTADMRLQQLLHELYMEHPELQAYIPEKPLTQTYNKHLRCGNRQGLLGRTDQTHHRMDPKHNGFHTTKQMDTSQVFTHLEDFNQFILRIITRNIRLRIKHI